MEACFNSVATCQSRCLRKKGHHSDVFSWEFDEIFIVVELYYTKTIFRIPQQVTIYISIT